MENMENMERIPRVEVPLYRYNELVKKAATLDIVNTLLLNDKGYIVQDVLKALLEMARRVGTSGAMLLDEYRTDEGFRENINADTVRLFKQYKLNGGQNDLY